MTATAGGADRARQVRRAVPLVLATLLLAVAAPDAATASPVRERVVVTFAEGTTAADRTGALAGTVPAAGRDIAVQSLPIAAAAPAVIDATPAERARLAGDGRVATITVDIPIRADSVAVEDPMWPHQDGVRRIRADEVWAETTGDPGVVIAVIDTGVDPANPDLAGRVVNGYDFVNRDTDPRDDNGHGTAAATVAAAAGDTYGIAGVCWRCRIMPVKVLDASGNGYLSDAAFGIAWAVEQGAHVLNVSLGSTGTMPVLDDALAAARDAGVLVVASAGNTGTSTEHWPAADPRVMGVAALDAQDQRAPYSSYGDWVDVAAPGCNPAGWLDNRIVEFCGTSSATPLVSGSAGLLMAARGVPGPQLRDALRDTAVPAGAGVGSGRIDAWAALRALPTFTDIAGSVHAADIEALAASGITTGCGGGRYCPASKVTRGQMATFLDRALDLPPATSTFADVPADHPHAAGIGAVAAAGITSGCDAQRFCPAAHLTRGQMATLLWRALRLADGPPVFADVPRTHPHARGIYALAAAQITTGCAPERFCPGAAVDRAQMASFLVRALDL